MSDQSEVYNPCGQPVWLYIQRNPKPLSLSWPPLMRHHVYECRQALHPRQAMCGAVRMRGIGGILSSSAKLSIKFMFCMSIDIQT